jgi:hypothetical protein
VQQKARRDGGFRLFKAPYFEWTSETEVECQPGGTSHLIKVSARSSREQAKDLRKQREVSSAVSLTCFGGVSSELPLTASQLLEHHGVVPDAYVLSPHSVSLLHSLVQQA